MVSNDRIRDKLQSIKAKNGLRRVKVDWDQP